MDSDDNDAKEQNLHLAGEPSSKVSPALHPYSLPKFDFDDSVQGNLRFDSLVENEVFLGITSQEDNQWIEEYSRGPSAIQFSSSVAESRVKDVWSEATSSESVEMLLNSVGQEDKVVEETTIQESANCDNAGSLTNVMDPNLKQRDGTNEYVNATAPAPGVFDENSKVSSDCDQSHPGSQVIPVSGGNLDSVVIDDKNSLTLDDVNEEAVNLANESVVNDLQEDPSVSMIECGNVNASAEECRENSEEVLDTIVSSLSKNSCNSVPEDIIKKKENLIPVSPKSNVKNPSFEEAENGVGSDNQFNNNVDKTSMAAEETSNKDEAVPNFQTMNSNQSSAPDMDQDFTLNESGGARLPLDFRDKGCLDSEKNIKPSSSPEGWKAIAQGSEPNMPRLTDTVDTVECSKISSSSRTDATGDIVTEDQPISPILGVSLLHDDNKEKAVGFSQKGAHQEVDNTLDCSLNGTEKVVHCDSPVGNCNTTPSEEKAEDNPTDLKESVTGDGVEPLNLAVNMPVQQQASVSVAGSSEHDTNQVMQNGGGSTSLDKPQISCFSDTKSIEVSQTGNNKHENSPHSKASNDREGLQSVSSSRATKEEEEKGFTFKVSTSTGAEQTGIQNLSSPKNTKVSSVIKDSLVSLQTPGSSATKSRRKSAGKETASKVDSLKETIPRKRSRKIEKSSPLLNPSSIEELKPDESAECRNQQSFNENQQVQLRAQILVYGSLISGTAPEETHMVAAFGQSDGGRKAWEVSWHACVERFHARKMSQSNNPSTPCSDVGNKDLDQGIKVSSTQKKILSPLTPGTNNMTLSSTVVSPMIPVASPLWNVSTPISPLVDYRQTPRVQNFASQSSFSSSPITAFGARISALPVTESVKLTTVKESGSPGVSIVPLDQTAGSTSLTSIKKPTVSSGQPSDLKSRKRKKIAAGGPLSDKPQAPHSEVYNQTISSTSAGLLTPVSIISKTNLGSSPLAISSASTHGQTGTIDQIVEKKIVTKKEIVSKIEESKVQPADQTNSSTSAGLLAPVSITSKTNLGSSLLAISSASTHGQTGTIDQNVEKKIVTEKEIVSKIKESKVKPADQTNSSTSAGLLTPVSITCKTNLGSSLLAISPASTHGQTRTIDQNVEKKIVRKEIVSKIEESKVEAADAAVHAADAISHCQDVWSQLEKQKSSGLVSDDEAKLASSAVSIAAAASVAKVAAAAAKIASNVAEQARLMADEVFQSSRTENSAQNSMISAPHANVGPNFDKSTPVSVLKNAKKSDDPSTIISVAREAARRRIEAASAASKHAENLDAIVKAAELAAEAVAQAGIIVAMGNPMPITELVEAGPEGYWKTSDKQILEGAASDKDTQTLKDGLSPQKDLAKNQMISTENPHKDSDLLKTLVVSSESELGSIYTCDVDQNLPESTSGTCKENSIKEGCVVEVYKDGHKNKGAWFAANVLTLKDGKAFICYTEIQSDEGQLKEWVPLEVEGTDAPRIRIAHSMTNMRFEGTRKRNRTDFTDYSWFNGDKVDVWVQDRWREAVILETNKTDVTSLKVQFPGEGVTSVVRSWHVRPTLIWKDSKWISLKGCHSLEGGDTPQQKRVKVSNPVVEVKEKDNSSNDVQQLDTLPLSGQFDAGKNVNKIESCRTIKRGLQKERSKVVFGVPKPGKKQKFMDVSKHYVDEGSSKNNSNPPTNDTKEKQVAEMKSKIVNPRKPPVPSLRTLAQKDKSKSTKPMSRDAVKTVKDSTSKDVVEDTSKRNLTSKTISQRFNKGKVAATKVEEVKEKSTSESEPRRSNRKIQPTSRLLEGLQSSLSILKTPTSHSSQRSHNNVTPKGTG